MENDFGNLEEIVNDGIRALIETKSINIGSFFNRMEEQFTRLGYRRSAMRGG